MEKEEEGINYTETYVGIQKQNNAQYTLAIFIHIQLTRFDLKA